MKKPKVSLDGAKLKALFIQHVEKLLLVVVAAVSIFLVYQGFSVPGLSSTQSPKGLLEASREAKNFIDTPDRWEKEVKQSRLVSMDIEQGVGASLTPTDPSAYFLANTWSKPSFPKLSPRKDPALFQPQHLKVVAVVGPLAGLKMGDDFDPLAPPPVEEGEDAPKPKPKSKSKAKPKPAILDPLDPMGMGGGSSKKAKSKRPRGSSSEGMTDQATLGMTPEMDMAMMGGATGGMGGSSAVAQTGGINPEAVFGYEANGQNAKAVPAQAIVVMAVVPYEKQLEEFQAALAESLDYDPVRDAPLYEQFFVERADVTVDPTADPATLTWTRLGTNAALYAARTTWAGALGEIVDLRYIDPKLTHPAPPFMQRDSWELLTHAEVPLAALAASDGGAGRGTNPGKTRPKEPTIISDEPVSGSDAGSGATGGSMLGGNTQGGSNFGGAGPSMPGGGMTGMPTLGGPAMGSMEGMASGYGSASGMVVEPPKYKLIRYTDSSAEPNHKYRYRLKVLLHDPNHPKPGYTPPSPQSLAQDVQERLKKVDQKIYYVESVWSEPSPVAELPTTNHYFAGAVTVAKPTPVNNVPVPVTQPVAKALSVVWDPAKAADVPGESDVYRGSVLNYVVDAKVVHPVSHRVVDLDAYRLATEAIVADIMGGEEIPMLDKGRDKEALKAPGELLIVDAEGNLHVQNETDDIEGYRRYLLPEGPETEEPVAGGNDPMGMMGGGLLDMPMPGMGGPPKRKGR